jgi:2-polyprenyl-3-methyl-5-hydroxy-6-metoxy-1,4-benzoquinol methylase
MSELTKHHEYVGHQYDSNHEEDRLERDDPIEYAITLRYLERYVADGVTVADIGVGGGQYSALLAQRRCRIHLVDVSQHLLATTTARLRDRGLAAHIVTTQRASATDLSHLSAGSCEVVLLLGPLYHLLTPEERVGAVAEAARLLRPGGLIFAAGINRLTYLRDVVRTDPNEFARRPRFFEQFWIDGNLTPQDGQPATMHATTAAELRAELGTAFEEVVLTGVEAFASKSEGRLAYLAATPTTRAAMLDQIERAGTTPEGLGVTSHYLYIGRLMKGCAACWTD